MSACVVIGAGASLANAEYFHPMRMTERNPPLDFTFFDKIRALKLPVGRDLRRYATEVPTGNPFEAKRTARMEEFFKDLFYDFLQQSGTTSSVVLAYTQLLDLYRSVLRETTNWMSDDHYRGGPVGRILAQLGMRHDVLTVITFNQDLVIENELVKRSKLANRWCINEGYGSFSTGGIVVDASAGRQFALHGASCDHARPITF